MGTDVYASGGAELQWFVESGWWVAGRGEDAPRGGELGSLSAASRVWREAAGLAARKEWLRESQ